MIMGNNGWYFTENDKPVSSYTDFTNGTYTEFTNSSYTDLTGLGTAKPAKKKVVRKASVKKAPVRRRKKRIAGKVFFCLLGTSVIVLTTFLFKDGVVQACTQSIIDEYFCDSDTDEDSERKSKKTSKEAFQKTEELTSYDISDPAYAVAEDIMASLWRDNDVDTAWEIFNWVHSNITYQSLTTYTSFEEAAFDGFTTRCGDCYVYFACSKMLLDCAGIPNLMVERYPVVTNSHFWNLVELDGEWYHCDATVFRDHPGMFFMCTDEEINDGHHSFDPDLYPERASGYYYGDYDYSAMPFGEDEEYWNQPYTEYYDDTDDAYIVYDEYYFDDYYVNEYEDPYVGYDNVYSNE